MEDKKLFTTFITITIFFNILLVYLLVSGLIFYTNNLQNYQNSQKLTQEFNSLFNQYQVNTNFELKDLSSLKNRYSGTTSISGYIEKLVFKTNEKSVQLFKNTIISSNENEINMEVTFLGSFDSIAGIIKEIEEELPFTEITNSSVQSNGNLYKVNVDLRILIEKND